MVVKLTSKCHIWELLDFISPKFADLIITVDVLHLKLFKLSAYFSVHLPIVCVHSVCEGDTFFLMVETNFKIHC